MYKPADEETIDALSSEIITISPAIAERPIVYVKRLHLKDLFSVRVHSNESLLNTTEFFGIFDDSGKRLAITSSLAKAAFFSSQNNYEMYTIS